LIAVIGGQEDLSYMFLIFPTLTSSIALLLVALIINNLFGLNTDDAKEGKGGYPLSWA